MSEKLEKRQIIIRSSYGFWVRPALPGDDVTLLHTREKSDGSKVDELKFNVLSGYIQDLFVTTKEFPKSGLVFFMNLLVLSYDDGEVRNIRIPMMSDVGQDILDRIENLDISRKTKIKIGFNKERERSFAWIQQCDDFGDWNNVLKVYTKDTPGDKPKWKKIEGDKPFYDKTDQRKWWSNKIAAMRPALVLNKVTV